MPFVTEYLWQKLPHAVDEKAELLMLASWPEPETLSCWLDEEAERSFELLRAVVGTARSVRARYRLSPRQELEVAVRAQGDDVTRVERQRATICEMGRLSSLTVAQELERPASSVVTVEAGLEIYVALAGLVDLEQEAQRISKQLEAQRKELAGVEKTLANPAFVAKSIALLEAQIRDLS